MQISLRALNWTTDWACKSGLLQCRCSAFFFDLSELSVLESVHELWFFFSLFVLSVSKNFWACWRLVCVCVSFLSCFCVRAQPPTFIRLHVGITSIAKLLSVECWAKKKNSITLTLFKRLDEYFRVREKKSEFQLCVKLKIDHFFLHIRFILP